MTSRVPASTGAPSQNFESTFDQYDAQGADDFVVTDAGGWTVSGFNFQITATSDPSSATYDIIVLPDAGGVPGSTPACSYPPPQACSVRQYDAVGDAADAVLAVRGHVLDRNGRQSRLPRGRPGVLVRLRWRLGCQREVAEPGSGLRLGLRDVVRHGHLHQLVEQPGGGGQTAFLFQVLGTTGGGGTCGAGQLCLESTVGTDTTAGACGTADTIDATVGDQLNFCYRITNNTGIELDYHTLTNNVDGTLFSLLNQPVPNGGTFQYNNIENVTATATYNSTWTGQDVPPGYSSEVTGGGGGGCPDRIFSDGFEGTPIPCGGGNFIDITQTGTPLNNGDDQAIAVTMPFSFNFYGTTSNQICVDNNGFILFNTTACPSSGLFTNVSLPAASISAPAMFPMWDDFDSESGNVYTDTRGSSPNRKFIVEWFDRVHFSGSSNTDGATFELILNEDGTIQFEYSDVDFTGGQENADCSNGACATIGLQNDPSLFNQFSAFQPSVTDNSGILWTATDPQVFNGTDSVTVNVGAPNIVVNDGNPIGGSVGEGETTTIPVPIANTGDRDLNWTINEAGPADRHFPQGPARVAKPWAMCRSRLSLPLRSHCVIRSSPARSRGRRTACSRCRSSRPTSTTTTTRRSTHSTRARSMSSTRATATRSSVVRSWTATSRRNTSSSVSSARVTSDEFGSIDTATGAFTSIGSATNNLGEGYAGMSWDPVSGQLYAVSSTCGSSSHL